MSIFKQSISRKTKWQIALVTAAIVVLAALVTADVIWDGPLTQLLANRDQVVQVIRDSKVLGPLIFVVLYVVQSVIAPIPGQVAGVAGGFVFGWWGILWSVIGTAIGFYLIFLVARKLGRPFVEKLIKKELLDKFDFLLARGGPMVFFLIFLLPLFPDDVIGYIAGLSKIPINQLMALVLLGRLPAIVMNNYFGMGLGEENKWPLIIVSVLTVLVLMVMYLKKDWLMQKLRGMRRKK
jgi:uncharacterized membrane protein YdjX (TVP38/TMEM64 family)